MRNVIRATVMITVASILCGTSRLSAQGGGGGGGGGSSKQQTLDPEEIAEARSLNTENPIGFILAHAVSFSLADTQITKLTVIKAQVQRENAELQDRLDSISPPGSVSRPNFANMTPEQLDSLRAQRKAMADTKAQMSENSRHGRLDAMAVLTPDQVAKYNAYVIKMHNRLEDAAMTGQAGPNGTPIVNGQPPR